MENGDRWVAVSRVVERARTLLAVTAAMGIVALSALRRAAEALGREVVRSVTLARPYARAMPTVTVRWVRPHVAPALGDVRAALRVLRPVLAALNARRRAVFVGAVALVNVTLGSALAAPVAVDIVASTVDVSPQPFDPLAMQTEVVAADGSSLGVLPDGVRRDPVGLDEVPPMVRSMILAAEDRRFYDHEGFDARAILRAATSNVRAGGVTQGASTITQQLAKGNITGDDRTPARKVREIVHARALEDALSKDELFERYLNEVYFGAGAYGIGAAARTYFGRTVAELEVHQAAMLAAVIRAPSVLDPWTNGEGVIARRNAVLRLAAEDGALDAPALHAAIAAPLGVLDAPLRPPVVDPQMLALIDREIAVLDVAGRDSDGRSRRARRAGWRIETTLEPDIQHAAANALAERLDDDVSGSVAVVEPGTGRIVAVANHQPGAPATYPLASEGKRQPGSAFKPFAAIAALEAGLRLDQQFEGRGPRRFDLGREDWSVDNFDGADYESIVLRDALRDSVNTAFAQLAIAVGTDEIAETAHDLGISSSAIGAPSQRGPAIALGGLHRGVSPLELTEAYAAIATSGAHAPAAIIERIRDSSGRVVYERSRDAEQSVDARATSTVRSMLEDVVSSGTGKAAALPNRPAFGKTGTSQDRADAWFAGAVPQLAAVVWVGHPDSREPMPEATGGTTAAPIWRDVMSAALAGDAPEAFDPPTEPVDNPGIALPEALPCDRRCRADD